MRYTREEVMQYVKEEDVRFVRLAFCDIFGRQKNIAILPTELPRAFDYGIAIDASAIAGFGGEVRSDLILHPDPATLTSLPWRSDKGRVIRMFCTVTHPDGRVLAGDSRALLAAAAADAARAGVAIDFGADMDIAPDDKGENIRREICVTLAQMGIQPETAHHEEGPGQNEIDFRYSDPLSAADNAITFRSVVQTIAAWSGLVADFSPKPLPDKAGSGFHINISVRSDDGRELLPHVIAGIMDKIAEMTVFFNPCKGSYERLGSSKAPRYITWSTENRSQLIRIPAAPQQAQRAELRSPDPSANPYLAFALLIRAGLHGIENRLPLPQSTELNLFTAPDEVTARFRRLPATLEEAAALARSSDFVRAHLPQPVIAAYCGH